VTSRAVEQDVLRHQPSEISGLKPAGDPITGRVPLLTNDDVTLLRCRPVQPQVELFRTPPRRGNLHPITARAR